MSTKQRLLEYLSYKDIKKSTFYKQTGLSNGFLDKNNNISSDKIEIIISIYPELSLKWLVTGDGNMLHGEDNDNYLQKPLSEVKNFKNEKIHDRQEIPLYDISASAGVVSFFADTQIVPLDYVVVPNLPKVDGAVYVKGDSMYPILKSGDIILIKQVFNIDYISFGDMYLISFCFNDEEYICVKYLQKGEKDGCIKLVSQNKNHSEQEIPISAIRALAIVKASIRYNTMG